MELEEILQAEGEGLPDLSNESDAGGDTGQENEPEADHNEEPAADEAAGDDFQDEESGDEDENSGGDDDRLSAVERENKSLKKRIDQLVAQNHRNKDKAKRAVDEVAGLKAKISPESPWEADPEYVAGAQEHKNFETLLDDLGDLYETFAEDPEEARELAKGKPYERHLQGSDGQVRKNLRAVMNKLQKELFESGRKLGVIEDRYQRQAEKRNAGVAKVVEQFFTFIDDPEDPRHQTAMGLREQFSHLSSLPEFDFFIGAATEFVNSQAAGSNQRGAAPSGAPAKAKPVQRQGAIPKTGSAGRGAGSVTKTEDKFSQAVGALRSKEQVSDEDLASLLSQFD